MAREEFSFHFTATDIHQVVGSETGMLTTARAPPSQGQDKGRPGVPQTGQDRPRDLTFSGWKELHPGPLLQTVLSIPQQNYRCNAHFTKGNLSLLR